MIRLIIVFVFTFTTQILLASSDHNTDEIILPKRPFFYENLIFPPLPLSDDIPVALSEKNKRQFINNPTLITRNGTMIQSALQAKNFPLLHLVSVLVLLAVYFLLKASEGKTKTLKDLISTEDAKKMAFDRLKSFIITSPEQNESPSDFFVRLESAMKHYLDMTYNLGTATLTSQELEKRKIFLTDEELQSRIIDIIQEAENIKFSHKVVSDNQRIKAIDTIKQLLNS